MKPILTLILLFNFSYASLYINIKSNNASFKGVNLRSDTLNLDIDNDLDIQSLRDTQTSTNKGHSISGGIGFGNGAITSANAGTSSSKGSTLVKQTKLTSITANKINANVKGNTNIKGALFASGSFSEDGTFIDNEQLNLKTNTLTHANLSNTNYSYSNSLGANLNYSIGNTKNNNKQSSANLNKETSQSTSKISNIGINHSNSMGIKASKTLATLGKGNIKINSLEKSDDLSKLNQDVTKINKQLYESNTGVKVDASLDTRFLTEKGREEIAKDAQTAKEHTEDLLGAAYNVATDKNMNITNLIDHGRDRIASTKVKDFLEDTPQGQQVLKDLNSDPNSIKYQTAKATLLHKYEEYRGLKKTDVIHYDAKNTDQDLLKDAKNIDTQGATLTKGANKGTIVLDASGDQNHKANKLKDLEVAAHEAGELKYLQKGNGVVFKDDHQTKEAMNDALGESFSKRVNEASGNNLDQDYKASPNNHVKHTTNTKVNNLDIKKDGIEYRQLTDNEIKTLNSPKNIENFQKYYKETTGKEISPSVATRYLARAGASLVDKKYNETFNTNDDIFIAQTFIEDEVDQYNKLDSYTANDDQIAFTNSFSPDKDEYNNFEENIKDFANNKDFHKENLKVNKKDTSSNLNYAIGIKDDLVSTAQTIYDTKGKAILDGVTQIALHPIDTGYELGKDLRKKKELSDLYENVGEYDKSKQLKGVVVVGVVGAGLKKPKIKKPKSTQNNIDLKVNAEDINKLKNKDNWTSDQIKQANIKKDNLLKAAEDGKLKVNSNHGVTNTQRLKVTQQYRKDLKIRIESLYSNNPIAKQNALDKLEKSDIDHMIDLQLGGKNARDNLKSLDKSVNRSYGKQLDNILKELIKKNKGDT